MVLRINKRAAIRVASFVIAGFTVLAGFVINTADRLNSVKLQLSHRYQAALEEVASGIDNIAITLEKSLYAGTTGGMCGLTGELELQAGAVASAISSLPLGKEGITNVSKFVSQVSDYASVLLRKAVNGEDITQEERASLTSLAKTAKSLSSGLDEAISLYNSTENWQQEITNALSVVRVETDFDGAFEEMGQMLSDSPTLIYDGPFSDHIEERESKMLEEAEEISKNEALTRAAEFLSLPAQNLKFSSEEYGKMPSYRFTDGEVDISVTKRGGYISYYRRDTDVSESKLNCDSAVSKAEEFLKSREFNNMASTYYYIEENVCVINFAYMQGDVICYPDLIKVGVALENGDIVLYEAKGYIMNHFARTLNTPKATESQAAGVLSPNLKYTAVKMAVIPSGGQRELLCFEFTCLGQSGEEVLVYINAENLYEENILILLKTDGGALTK